MSLPSAAGRTVKYDYEWASGIASVGTSVTGGWIKTMTDANGRTMVDEQDVFGRTTKHTDLGAHVFRYQYNWAGLVTKQTGSTGQDVDYTYYSHGLVRSIVDNATKTQSLYEYDGDGNRTSEFFTNFGDSYVFAQSRVEYDALNRVVSISDNSYQVNYEYDAVGNRRRMVATYTDMVGYHQKTQDYWYEYDALNRFTVTMGTLSGERATDANDASVHIVAGRSGEGVQLGYDAAGERVMAVYAKDGRTERYEYDANGYLTKQTINGVLAQERTNDLMGRVTSQIQRDVKTAKVVSNATRVWDADSLQTSERDELNKLSTAYTRMADGTLQKIESIPDDGNDTRTVSSYSYEWWDGAKQSKVTVQPINPNAPGWKAATTYYNYDANGNLKSTFDDGGNEPGNARAFQYWTDLRGQVQRRSELTGVTVSASGTISGAEGVRKHNYYYLNGNRVGNQGNDGVDEIDYVQELAGKLGKGNESQYKVFTPVGTADFDENYMAINAAYPGVSPGTWTVRAGETLQSIASALWGDATLWYILADANGLQGSDVLKAGQTLTVPNKVTNVHNTATTFKPYDPGKAIGDTQPTLPDPPPPPGKGGGCGMALMIVAIVVTVIVTAVTYGATSELLYAELGVTAETASTAVNIGVGVAAGATAGAAGAAASQAVMIAGGQQSGFNWNGIAMGALGGALTGGVTAGLGTTTLPNELGRVGSAVALGALRSSVIQGLSMITGAQHSFDWKSMAASAIASGVGSAVGQTQLGKMQYVGAAAQGVAAGATSTLVRGGSLQRDAAAIVGDTIGAMVTAQMAQRSEDAARAKTEQIINGNKPSTPLGGVQPFSAQFDDAKPGVMYASNSIMSDVDDPYPYVSYSQVVAEGLPAIEVTASRMPGATAYGASYDGAIAGWAGDDSGRIDLNAAAFRGAMNDTSSSMLDSVKSFAKWTDEPIEWLQNVSQTVQRGNAIMAEGLNAIGLNGLAGAQRALGDITSSAVPTRPWEIALNAAPLVGEAGPMLKGGAAMFGATIESMAGRYPAIFGPRFSIAPEGPSFGGKVKSYGGNPLSADFVGPVDLNTQASRNVGNVTAPIDFDGHILSGEVKSNGSVVGGHSTVSGNVRVIPGTQSAPNAQGVYQARIEVPDPANPRRWLPKTNNGGMSTMFPDSWSADRIKVEVDAAYQNRVVTGNKWTGITPSGVTVQGWTTPKTTVYPLY